MENWTVRKTARGIRLIDGKGYTYAKDRSVGTKTFWQCDYKHWRCKARASVDAPVDARHRPKVMFNLMTHGHPAQMKRRQTIVDHNLESVQNLPQPVQSVLKPRNVSSPTSSGPPETPLGPAAEVCLRWNSYHTNMQTVFPLLMDNEKYVDVTLYAEGKGIKCHKLILSSCSTYFEEILCNMNPNVHTVIVLRGFAYWQVKALIAFMYKGEVNVDQSKLDDLLKAGSDLQIKGLAKEEKIPIATEDFDGTNDEFRENEIIDEPLPAEDENVEEYFPNPEYKKKPASVKPKRKRKISAPPDPSLLKQVKINLKGTKSRPHIKQPKYYSPDYPEYDPDRCVSAPKSGSDPVFHIDNIKLEPIDMDVANSPDFLEMDSMMNDSHVTDNSATETLPVTAKNRARIVTAKLPKQEKRKPETELSKQSELMLAHVTEDLSKLDTSVNKSMDTVTTDFTVPSTSKGITESLTTSTKRVIIEGPNKKTIMVKCPKRNSDESFILSTLTDASNKSDSDKLKPQIRVRNLATTETMLKKFATTQLTSILKKSEPINQTVICKTVGGMPRLIKAQAQTPPVIVEPDTIKYALVAPEEPEPKSDEEEMGEIETLDSDTEFLHTHDENLPKNDEEEDIKIDTTLNLPH